MNEITPMFVVAIFGGIISTLLMLLVGLIAWNWNRINRKLDEVVETLHKMAGDLHGRVNELRDDLHEQLGALRERITILETRQKGRKDD